MHAMVELLESTNFPAIKRARLETLQVNLGYKCNQSCLHCHVNAGPTRTEMMDHQIAVQVVEFLLASGVGTLDITGGAPELNPEFRFLVVSARQYGIHVIDRCNLTVLEEPGQAQLAEFLVDNRVEIIASLPCYLKENVDRQRGANVFDKSIRCLQRLNALGYGREGSGLLLNLVFNPQGPVLPPSQELLEKDYKKHLAAAPYGVVFNRLYTLTNMPIQRFGSTLVSKGQFNTYMDLLRGAHSIENLPQVMCRSLVSVDWRGYLYDCDFNQMLDLPLRAGGRSRSHISELMKKDLQANPIVVADHCFGCTAGQGSSCGGSL
ncbi:MAG: arsenosugar biosynthesis radical SAM (seleno)protein ArsS [Gammaproteobacteria bacterium]